MFEGVVWAATFLGFSPLARFFLAFLGFSPLARFFLCLLVFFLFFVFLARLADPGIGSPLVPYCQPSLASLPNGNQKEANREPNKEPLRSQKEIGPLLVPYWLPIGFLLFPIGSLIGSLLVPDGHHAKREAILNQ